MFGEKEKKRETVGNTREIVPTCRLENAPMVADSKQLLVQHVFAIIM